MCKEAGNVAEEAGNVAEFCPECWNALNGTKEQADNWLLSEDLELCEGCGKWTHGGTSAE